MASIDQVKGIITLQLRAERSAIGSGRIYTITITATDPSEDKGRAKVKVRVPHDQGGESGFYALLYK